MARYPLLPILCAYAQKDRRPGSRARTWAKAKLSWYARELHLFVKVFQTGSLSGAEVLFGKPEVVSGILSVRKTTKLKALMDVQKKKFSNRLWPENFGSVKWFCCGSTTG